MVRCSATTLKGQRCRRQVERDGHSIYCEQHNRIHTNEESDFGKAFQGLITMICTFAPSSSRTGRQEWVMQWIAWLVDSGQVQDACLPQTTASIDKIPQRWIQSLRWMHPAGYPERLLGAQAMLGTITIAYEHGRLSDTGVIDYSAPIHVTGTNTLNLKEALERCAQPISVFSLLLVSSTTGEPAHANALIIDQHSKTYERFEPAGGSLKESADVDRYLESADFREMLPTKGYHYISPNETCPVWAPQKVLAGTSMCVVYSMMYLHMRLLAPLSTPGEVLSAWAQFSKEQLWDLTLRYYGWVEQELRSRDTGPRAFQAAVRHSTLV